VRSLRDVVVHGIVAKPIIDVLVEVESLRRLDQETPALEAIGYEAKGEYGIPGRRYFRKDDARGVRTHQLHAFEKQSGHIARHLAFRDYMIAHPDEAQTYATLKQRLAYEHPEDIEAYMDGKNAYIKEQERRALLWWTGHGVR
jgi:GrpB-like predicted nucleotidyltransferase (UPF0157 family)